MICNIIHLSERKDRMTILLKELAKQGIVNYKMWEGIKNDETPWQGISQAHKQIVKYAKDCTLPSVLIAEDDIKFTDAGAYSFFLNNIPTDFDLYLGGIIYGSIKENNTTNDFSGTMLYVINERFYDVFLALPEESHIEPEESHIDRALKNKGKFIVCNPIAVIQHNGYSDNTKRHMNYERYINNKTLFRMRR